MKARVLTSKERQREAKIIETLYREKVEDACKRAQFVCFSCMLEIGLSPRTINRIIAMYPAMCDKYKEYKTEQIADFFFSNYLQKAGVNVEPVEKEEF